MTIASDFAAAAMAVKKLTVTSTSTLITGTSGLAGEAIPNDCKQLTLFPSGGECYYNFGTASATTALVPATGLIFNAATDPTLKLLQLYSPTGCTVLAIFGGQGGRLLGVGGGGGGDVVSYDSGEAFTILIDNSAETDALVDPTPSATKAESIGAAAHGVISTRGKKVARLMIGGVGDADDVFNWQAILWSQAVGLAAEGWIPRVIANGTATLGTDVYAVAGVGGATNKWCDAATDTILDGCRIYNTTNLRAVIEIPLLDAERLEVQTDLSTGDPTKCDVFVQLSDHAYSDADELVREIASGTPDSGNASADADGSVREQLKYANDALDALKTLLAVGTGAMASAQAVTIATDDTVIGATDAAVVDAGAVGSVSAKLRRLTTDLGALNTLLAVGTGAMASAQAVTIATDDTVMGATDAAVVDAGAVGSVSQKLRRLTTDLGALLLDMDTLLAGLPALSYANVQYKSIDQTADTGIAVLSTGCPASSKVYLMSLFGIMATAGNLTIEDEDGTNLSGPMPVLAGGGLAVGGAGHPVCATSATAKDMQILTTGKFYGHSVCIIK